MYSLLFHSSLMKEMAVIPSYELSTVQSRLHGMRERICIMMGQFSAGRIRTGVSRSKR